MALYKLLESGVINTASGVSFPADPGNRHYQEYLAWVALGNMPDPADQPSAEQLAEEQAIRDAPVGARDWFVANSQAKLIFSMTVEEVAAEIAALVDVSFPALSAANRTRWKLLLTAIVLVVRIYVKRERLDWLVHPPDPWLTGSGCICR